MAQFDPDLDEKALVASWESDDPQERNRVALLLGCFEKTYMLLMDLITLSVKLATRIGAIPDEKTSAVEILVNAEVISHDDVVALEKQREVRNTSQHIYVELSIPELRSAVLLQIEMTPPLVRNVVKWLESFQAAEDRTG